MNKPINTVALTRWVGHIPPDVRQDIELTNPLSSFLSFRRKELSTDQVNKPINTVALTRWVGHIPPDVRQDIEQLAPMLRRLGYDPAAYPPNYGTPDKVVEKHTAQLQLVDKLHRAQQGADQQAHAGS